MKIFILTVLAVGTMMAGCAQARVQNVAGVVGPAPATQSPASTGPAGTLIVYSALETNSPGATPFDDIRPHTAYDIYSGNGSLLKKVDNRDGALGENPSLITLQPGVYQIVALSNGHGPVRVSVRIGDHLVTAVHLDSEGPAISDRSKAVLLPNGEIVGWSSAQ